MLILIQWFEFILIIGAYLIALIPIITKGYFWMIQSLGSWGKTKLAAEKALFILGKHGFPHFLTRQKVSDCVHSLVTNISFVCTMLHKQVSLGEKFHLM